MNTYVTGNVIRELREKKGYTQAELGELLKVSSKTISKWENARGLPDISLLEPLAEALGVSIIELMNGEHIVNRNAVANMRRSRIYVCPVCGNVIHSTGEAVVSCCGVTLPPLEAEEADEMHSVDIEGVENEHFITVHHPMTKQHYISFMAYIAQERIQFVKMYPEGNAQTRMQLYGNGTLYYYCNRHGLFCRRV